MTAVTPAGLPVGRMQPFTVLAREDRVRRATEPRPADTDWMARAACRRADPALFQPIGESAAFTEQIDQAKAICRACPVLASCDAYSLETRQSAGIGAARTENERELEFARRRCARLRQAERRAA